MISSRHSIQMYRINDKIRIQKRLEKLARAESKLNVRWNEIGLNIPKPRVSCTNSFREIWIEFYVKKTCEIKTSNSILVKLLYGWWNSMAISLVIYPLE